ncbi:saccharopine dehydrogenase C-terminal domain-containing protein [Draconibacterium halophilum]|uniref:Saccharopine dehydrogenase n=1 Tax=Draconibacterium halophilum TaxID=2706887 RepID=A0A6C0RA83_9BACT|nr:saccharopine dehydrogenase C-terminal domain-containing protein [Draconibacterium halophilum]QIA07498.1 saccharopine dehydrogenase [Draconibacterium halophilum]
MKNILIFGAGRSSVFLLTYLAERALKYRWHIKVVGAEESDFVKRLKLSFSILNVRDEFARDQEVREADLVISMLPARFHKLVMQSCLKFSKSLFTASYESKEMQLVEDEVKSKGLLFLNECGLDPGLDHMSAMRVINHIKQEGHKLEAFESFTGGLVAPESDDNPWHYKFSWNPRNVVLAGQGGPAQFIQKGKVKYIPYNRLFRRTELIKIDDYGWFEGYANRDSLSYIGKYGLQEVPTVYRGTLRRPGFCKAWNVFVQLGATSDDHFIDNVEDMTYREFINSFLYYHPADTIDLKLYHSMQISMDSEIVPKLEWLGIFEKRKIGLKRATPAQVMEKLLSEKWQLMPDDKDMIVMWHKFEYLDRNTKEKVEKNSSLVVIGESGEKTAMAKTVGLPLAVAAKLFLTKKLNQSGICIPTQPEIYEPILDELEKFGIKFTETEKRLVVKQDSE